MSKELDDLIADMLRDRPKTEREILRGERMPPPEFVDWLQRVEQAVIQGTGAV